MNSLTLSVLSYTIVQSALLAHTPREVRVGPKNEIAWFVEDAQLPGCTAYGTTPDDALQNLKTARELYERDQREAAIDLVSPAPSPSVPSDYGNFALFA